jgi:hypothetical protein
LGWRFAVASIDRARQKLRAAQNLMKAKIFSGHFESGIDIAQLNFPGLPPPCNSLT